MKFSLASLPLNLAAFAIGALVHAAPTPTPAASLGSPIYDHLVARVEYAHSTTNVTRLQELSNNHLSKADRISDFLAANATKLNSYHLGQRKEEIKKHLEDAHHADTKLIAQGYINEDNFHDHPELERLRLKAQRQEKSAAKFDRMAVGHDKMRKKCREDRRNFGCYDWEVAYENYMRTDQSWARDRQRDATKTWEDHNTLYKTLVASGGRAKAVPDQRSLATRIIKKPMKRLGRFLTQLNRNEE